jgi:hypothetical protein
MTAAPARQVRIPTQTAEIMEQAQPPGISFNAWALVLLQKGLRAEGINPEG